MKPSLSRDETARLEALRQYDVLDTAPEQEFDDLTHLAAQICGTPISVISLVDEERLWFKSRMGMDAPEIPRAVSFCTQAIEQKDFLLVPDIFADARFANNGLVNGDPPIRFYAGVPLLTPEGHAVGTLCVLDTVPRQLDETQQDALHRLARQALALLEARPDAAAQKRQSRQARQRAERRHLALAAETARRDADSLKASETRYRRLFESAQDGILILDAQSGKIEDVNPCLCALLGYAPDDLVGRHFWEIGTFRDIAASQDAFRVLQEKAFRSDDLPLETKGGHIVSVEFVSNVYASGDKTVIQCNIRDISARKQAAAEQQESQRFLQSTLDALASHIAVVDEKGTIIAVNKAWREFAAQNQGTGASCGVGTNYLQVCEVADGAWAEEAPTVVRGIREVMAGRHQAFCLEYPCHGPSEERWFNVCVTPFAGEGPVRVVVAHENITARKRAEAGLRHSEANLARAQQIAHLGSWVWSLHNLKAFELNPLSWSDEVFRIFGYQPHAIGVSYQIFIGAVHPDDRAAVEEGLRLAFETGQNYDLEHRIVWPDGTERVVRERSEIVYGEEGRPSQMIGTVQDITERKQVENALRQSEERFGSIVANVPGMVYQFAFHPDGTLDWPFVSEGCREIYETEPQTLHNDPLWPLDRIHPDDRPEFDRSVAASAESLSPWRWEGRHNLDSGKTIWIQGASRPQRLPDGGTQWDGLVMNITALKQAEEERDRFFTLSLDMLTIVGSDGYFKRLNPAFEATLGFSNAELMAVPFLEFVHPDDIAGTLAQMANLESGMQVNRFENRYRCRDGSYKWLRWMAAPYEDLWYCVAHDVTGIRRAEAALHKANDELELHVMERTAELGKANEQLRVENIEHRMTMGALRQTAEELKQAKEEADAANAAKSEFLSRMSHELRTPLNSILGFGQILGEQGGTALQKESVGYILKAGRHLLDLINEVLDIARVEAGHLEISPEPIGLDDVVPQVCALLQPLAAERAIHLHENSSQLGGSYILADRQRLQQVIINLLSNAIKYNREGGEVEVFCDQKANGWTSIAVRDTGQGISPQDLPKLFTPFERLGASNSTIEGTGLGLVLSQRLVTEMGGTLKVESTLGQGTTFTLELAQATAPEAQLANLPHHTHSAGPKREVDATYCVLCIEDNPANLRLIEVLFQDRPELTLLAALQGGVGLDLARRHEPALILLDLNLPDINGKEVLARLQQSALTRDIPVVVVSADATPNQVERLLAAGARAYLTKPLDIKQLLRTLDMFLPPAPTLAPQPNNDEKVGN